MRFLIDNPLSPVVAQMLQNAGLETVHVLDYKLQAAPDEQIFARAVVEDRIIITGDTDFGLLLILSKQSKPSVILLHHSFPHRPEQQGSILLEYLSRLEDALDEGSLVVFEKSRIRIRSLPLLS